MSPSRAPPGDAVSRCRDVIEVLSSPPCTNYLIDELMQLLASPHIQVSLKLISLCMSTYLNVRQDSLSNGARVEISC